MAIIKSIGFVNFKKFERFGIACGIGNILVGPNNAGKSSILDSLRVLSDLIRATRRERPRLVDQAGIGVCATYSIPANLLSVPLLNTVRNYGNEQAQINFALSNGRSVHIRLHPDEGAFGFLSGAGQLPRTGGAFRRELDLDIVIVPTLSALEADERYVQDATVQRNENTRLASRSFRNILLRKNRDEFQQFVDYCKIGWPEIDIDRPVHIGGADRAVVMLYHEEGVEREVQWSGFGFQVWMQIMLQFQRAKTTSVLVLDEPDIYLHADLQRRLLKVAQTTFAQHFLATHSTEIINDADPGDVLMIDSSNRWARRISNDDGYKRVYAYLGSSENAEFARIAKADRIVFFEGNERNVLRKFAKKLRADEIFDDPKTIYLQSGGFSQWRKVKEVDWTLHEIFGLKTKIGALFDRDFRCEEEVVAFERDIANQDLWVGVLRRKEIENYALAHASIIRTLVRRAAERDIDLLEHEAERLIDETADRFVEDSKSQRAAMYMAHMRSVGSPLDDATLIRTSNESFNQAWADRNQRLTLLPGKDFIAALSSLTQNRHGFSVTIHQLIDDLHREEVDGELAEKLDHLADFFAAH